MVSAADRDAETLIHSLLRDERPDDGLLAEEGGREAAESGRRWVVDPLDGTTNFLYGFPQWAVSVALEDADGGLVGVVFDPVRDELFCAVRGEGATLDGAPLRMAVHAELATALVATGFGYDPERRGKQVRGPVVLADQQGRRTRGEIPRKRRLAGGDLATEKIQGWRVSRVHASGIS